MIESFRLLRNGSHGTSPQTGSTGTTIRRRGRIGDQRKVRQNGNETDSGSIFFIDQEVIPSDPSQSCHPRHMLVGEMSFLGLPIHNLGGRNGEGQISQVL